MSQNLQAIFARIILVLLDFCAIFCVSVGLQKIFPPLMWIFLGCVCGWLAHCVALQINESKRG